MSQDEAGSPLAARVYADGANFRNYGSNVGAIAADWFSRPLQDLDVLQRGDYSATADGACEVSLPNDALAFAKPRPGNPNSALIAREKIASDLGFLLGMPVAPVVIRTPQPTKGWPEATMLSLNCLPTGRLWSAGGEAHIKQLAPHLEALRVFWSWICDTDHNGHGQNIAWQVGSDLAVVAGFDHSYCLGHDGQDPLTAPICQGYGTAALPEAKFARDATLARIEGISWADVVSIVERLAPVLSDVEQKRILRVLEVRRGDIRRLLG